MEHIPSMLQAASLGSVGLLLAQPDGAHLALYGIIFTGLCSIITTSMNRRADRKRDAERYARDKEEREFQAAQLQAALVHGANAGPLLQGEELRRALRAAEERHE